MALAAGTAVADKTRKVITIPITGGISPYILTGGTAAWSVKSGPMIRTISSVQIVGANVVLSIATELDKAALNTLSFNGGVGALHDSTANTPLTLASITNMTISLYDDGLHAALVSAAQDFGLVSVLRTGKFGKIVPLGGLCYEVYAQDDMTKLCRVTAQLFSDGSLKLIDVVGYASR